MAAELSWRGTETGVTLYATIRSAARTMWSTAGSALEALTVANWGDYDLALSETPASSYFYVGDWPASLSTAGWYWVDIFKRAGGSPAIGDTLQGTLVVYWNGTTASPWDAAVATIAANAVTAAAIANGAIDAATFAAGAIDSAAIATGAIDADALAADAGAELAAALLDLANGVETDYTLRQALRLLLASQAGKTSGGGTATFTIRSATDSKNRIVATVDADGNRSAVVLDAT